MFVRDLMKTPRAIGPAESLDAAARILWEHDCGVVPVVDAQERVVGMLTDRDICMAAYTQGRTLHSLPVHLAMAQAVVRCRPTHDAEAALRIMAEAQVHRLPVVDENDRLLGILSVTDVLHGLQRQPAPARARLAVLAADALAMIVSPRAGERRSAKPAARKPAGKPAGKPARKPAAQRAKAASR